LGREGKLRERKLPRSALKLPERPCEFKGDGCLGEFEPKSPNQKNCKVCQADAKRARNLATALAAYAANPEFFRAKARAQRAKDPAATKAKKNAYRTANKDRLNANERARRALDREKYAAKQRAKYAADPVKYRALGKRSREKHKAEILPRDRARAKLQRELAKEAMIIRGLSSKPASWQKIVPMLLLHREMSNAEVQKLAGTDLSKETMRRLRDHCGVPGPKGRLRKSL
jgi:hypothetical protein